MTFLHISGILQTENGTNRKRQLPFVFCKRKAKRQTSVYLLQMETENGRLFFLDANDKL
jgi:hypothetical protein